MTRRMPSYHKRADWALMDSQSAGHISHNVELIGVQPSARPIFMSQFPIFVCSAGYWTFFHNLLNLPIPSQTTLTASYKLKPSYAL